MDPTLREYLDKLSESLTKSFDETRSDLKELKTLLQGQTMKLDELSDLKSGVKELEATHDNVADALTPAEETADIVPVLAASAASAKPLNVDATGATAPTPTTCSTDGSGHATGGNGSVGVSLILWDTIQSFTASLEASLTQPCRLFVALELDTKALTRCSAICFVDETMVFTYMFVADVTESITRQGQVLRPIPWPSFKCHSGAAYTIEPSSATQVQELDALSVNTSTSVTSKVDHGVVFVISRDFAAPTLTMCSTQGSRCDATHLMSVLSPVATPSSPTAIVDTFPDQAALLCNNIEDFLAYVLSEEELQLDELQMQPWPPPVQVQFSHIGHLFRPSPWPSFKPLSEANYQEEPCSGMHSQPQEGSQLEFMLGHAAVCSTPSLDNLQKAIQTLNMSVWCAFWSQERFKECLGFALGQAAVASLHIIYRGVPLPSMCTHFQAEKIQNWMVSLVELQHCPFREASYLVPIVLRTMPDNCHEIVKLQRVIGEGAIVLQGNCSKAEPRPPPWPSFSCVCQTVQMWSELPKCELPGDYYSSTIAHKLHHSCLPPAAVYLFRSVKKLGASEFLEPPFLITHEQVRELANRFCLEKLWGTRDPVYRIQEQGNFCVHQVLAHATVCSTRRPETLKGTMQIMSMSVQWPLLSLEEFQGSGHLTRNCSSEQYGDPCVLLACLMVQPIISRQMQGITLASCPRTNVTKLCQVQLQGADVTNQQQHNSTYPWNLSCWNERRSLLLTHASLGDFYKLLWDVSITAVPVQDAYRGVFFTGIITSGSITSMKYLWRECAIEAMNMPLPITLPSYLCPAGSSSTGFCRKHFATANPISLLHVGDWVAHLLGSTSASGYHLEKLWDPGGLASYLCSTRALTLPMHHLYEVWIACVLSICIQMRMEKPMASGELNQWIPIIFLLGTLELDCRHD